MFGSDFGGIQLVLDDALNELPVSALEQSANLRVVARTRPVLTPDSWIHHWMAGSDVIISLGKIEGRYVLRFEDGACFEVDPEAGTVTHPRPLDGLSRHQLLDQVLPRVLEHLGHLMIHGSAVAAPGGAVVFVGETGLGKSTLAASFQRVGTGILSDDCMRLTIDPDGGVSCVPTYRSLRLWPDSADTLMGAARSEPMSAGSAKRRVDLPPDPITAPARVGAICLLSEPKTTSAEIRISSVAPATAVSLLLAQCFRLDPTDPDSTKRTFERCADIVERVAVVELSYPRDYDRLSEVCYALLERAATGDWSTVKAT